MLSQFFFRDILHLKRIFVNINEAKTSILCLAYICEKAYTNYFI